jgi:signal transduction histidine kinase
MEGFRILPYGDQKNDWLSLDSDYAGRSRVDPLVGFEESVGSSLDRDEFLIHLPNRSYFGAVFLTQARAPTLKLVVNREGFVPDPAFENVVKLVRTGANLATRVRAAVKARSRKERRTRRQKEAASPRGLEPLTVKELEEVIERASSLARDAEKLAKAGDISRASQSIAEGVELFRSALSYAERLIDERSMVRVLASVGTQMAGFVHELNALLAMSQTVEKSLNSVRDEDSLSRRVRGDLSRVIKAIGDLRRNLERQASYLVDIITPDARRRRSRQNLTDRFESGRRLVEHIAEQQGIRIANEIPADLKSPPMFPAELTAVFSNLLTNAVKAGRIRAWARRLPESQTRVILENSGVRVDLKDGERWFQPFESTTATVDAVLGQGMGLGLPITRSILEEYGAEIKFTKPSPGYSTAVEIMFPE